MGQRYLKIDQLSIESYHKFVQSGQKLTIGNQVLAVLSHRPMTRNEMVSILGVDKCNICSPLKQLENQNKIRKNGRRYDESTNRWGNVYELIREEQSPAEERIVMVQNPQIIENEPYQ